MRLLALALCVICVGCGRNSDNASGNESDAGRSAVQLDPARTALAEAERKRVADLQLELKKAQEEHQDLMREHERLFQEEIALLENITYRHEAIDNALEFARERIRMNLAAEQECGETFQTYLQALVTAHTNYLSALESGKRIDTDDVNQRMTVIEERFDKASRAVELFRRDIQADTEQFGFLMDFMSDQIKTINEAIKSGLYTSNPKSLEDLVAKSFGNNPFKMRETVALLGRMRESVRINSAELKAIK